MSTLTGRGMMCAALLLRGEANNTHVSNMMTDICNALGMCAIKEPQRWDYPVNGKGGYGYTIVQPITESFIIADVWPKIKAVYIYIASCKPFSPGTLCGAAQRFFVIEESKFYTLAASERYD